MMSDKTLTAADRALVKVADLIIERMEQLKDEQWQKGWLTGGVYSGLPQNLSGRQYQGTNMAILSVMTAINGHEIPVFTTFNDAVKEGLKINKGAKSVPVIYCGPQYKDAEGNRIDEREYRQMSAAERKHVTSYNVLKKFDVFNIADTNFREVNPERYEMLKQLYAPTKHKIYKACIATLHLTECLSVMSGFVLLR